MNLFLLKNHLFKSDDLIGCIIILSLAIALKAQHISHLLKMLKNILTIKPMKSVLDVLQSKYNFKLDMIALT